MITSQNYAGNKQKVYKTTTTKILMFEIKTRRSFELDNEEVYELSNLIPLLHELWVTGPGMTEADLGGCAV